MSAAFDWKKAKERGGELLDFWAASMKARSDQNGDHRGLFRESMPSSIAAQLKSAEKGGKPARVKRPEDIDDDAWKVLQVEGAFVSMAARATESVYGRFCDQQDDEARANWSKFRDEARRRIRGICLHVLVHGQRPATFQAKDTLAHLALYGSNGAAFGRWISHRIDDVREFLGS